MFIEAKLSYENCSLNSRKKSSDRENTVVDGRSLNKIEKGTLTVLFVPFQGGLTTLTISKFPMGGCSQCEVHVYFDL